RRPRPRDLARRRAPTRAQLVVITDTAHGRRLIHQPTPAGWHNHAGGGRLSPLVTLPGATEYSADPALNGPLTLVSLSQRPRLSLQMTARPCADRSPLGPNADGSHRAADRVRSATPLA